MHDATFNKLQNLNPAKNAFGQIAGKSPNLMTAMFPDIRTVYCIEIECMVRSLLRNLIIQSIRIESAAGLYILYSLHCIVILIIIIITCIHTGYILGTRWFIIIALTSCRITGTSHRVYVPMYNIYI